MFQVVYVSAVGVRLEDYDAAWPHAERRAVERARDLAADGFRVELTFDGQTVEF